MKRIRVANTAGIPAKGIIYITGKVNPKDNGYFTYDGVVLTKDKQPFYNKKTKEKP